jgi:hypothetical protein
MANAVVPADLKVPAHLAGRIGAPSKLSDAIGSGLGSGGVPRISIKGARFRIIDEGSETVLPSLELEIVIVGAGMGRAKMWYAKQWTPDEEPTQPDCFSINGEAPDAAAINPQSDLCATCPQNAWGSRITPQGTQIKACPDYKRLAVVSTADPAGPVYLLQVTPAALKGLQEYRKTVTLRGIPFEIIATRVGFDTSASFPKLTFNFSRFLTAEEQATIDARLGSDEVKEITGEKVTYRTKQLAVASQPPEPVVQKIAEVAPAPAPIPAPAKAPARGFAKVMAPAAESGDLLGDIEKLLANERSK